MSSKDCGRNISFKFNIKFSKRTIIGRPIIARSPVCCTQQVAFYSDLYMVCVVSTLDVATILLTERHDTQAPHNVVHSDTNSASPGSILAMQQLRATTKSLTCPPLSIARYSFIQLSQLGHQWRERKCPVFETEAKRDSNPDSLDGKSGILLLSYRAPYVGVD